MFSHLTISLSLSLIVIHIKFQFYSNFIFIEKSSKEKIKLKFYIYIFYTSGSLHVGRKLWPDGAVFSGVSVYGAIVSAFSRWKSGSVQWLVWIGTDEERVPVETGGFDVYAPNHSGADSAKPRAVVCEPPASIQHVQFYNLIWTEYNLSNDFYLFIIK